MGQFEVKVIGYGDPGMLLILRAGVVPRDQGMTQLMISTATLVLLMVL